MSIIVLKIELKFQNSKMTPAWKVVDQDYKFLAVYTGSTTTFSFDVTPTDVSLSPQDIEWPGAVPNEIPNIWDVTASADRREINVTFKQQFSAMVTVRVLGCSKTVWVRVIDQPSGISEEAYALLHPKDTLAAATWNLIGLDPTTLEPFVWAAAQYPGIQQNTIADAARHAYWNAMLTSVTSASYAEGLTNAHEVRTPPGPSTETWMDLTNNGVGRSLSVSMFEENFVARNRTAVKGAVSQGSLYYLDSSYGVTNTKEDALLQPTDK